MDEDLTPSGNDVVSTGVSGFGDFGRALGGLFISGLSRSIDLEFARRQANIDTTVIERNRTPPPPGPGGGTVIAGLTPLQLGGLAVAGALTVALLAGAFR